jgi:hypothetical protein
MGRFFLRNCKLRKQKNPTHWADIIISKSFKYFNHFYILTIKKLKIKIINNNIVQQFN